ncbi:hypothetical protein [Arthrobacter sp. D1-17]
MTTTQGLAGSVSEYCLERRDAADGGAAAPVAGAVADGDAEAFAVPGAGAGRVACGADDSAGRAEGAVDAAPVGDAVPRGTAGEPVGDGGADVVLSAADCNALEPDGDGPEPTGVQAASAVSPAPERRSRVTVRRPGVGEQSPHMWARPS